MIAKTLDGKSLSVYGAVEHTCNVGGYNEKQNIEVVRTICASRPACPTR